MYVVCTCIVSSCAEHQPINLRVHGTYKCNRIENLPLSFISFFPDLSFVRGSFNRYNLNLRSIRVYAYAVCIHIIISNYQVDPRLV